MKNMTKYEAYLPNFKSKFDIKDENNQHILAYSH
jgi:hypothetical protein